VGCAGPVGAPATCSNPRCPRVQAGVPSEASLACRCGAAFCGEACWIGAWHAGHQACCPCAGEIAQAAAEARSRRRGAALLAHVALRPCGGTPVAVADAKVTSDAEVGAAAAGAASGSTVVADPRMAGVEVQVIVEPPEAGVEAAVEMVEAQPLPPLPLLGHEAPKGAASGDGSTTAQTIVNGNPVLVSPKASGAKVACFGHSLCDFEHLADLGAGASGMVTKVACKRTGEVFALKAIERHRVEEQCLQAYVEREVATQRCLDHPNIVRLHDHFEEGDRIYLLLEYAPEGHLFRRIRRQGQLPASEAAAIFADVLAALVHLHGRGVVHRDLKPENVVLFPGGRAKLADFGWCAELKRDGRQTFCGTMDYLSPEMVARRPHDHRVDAWAAGVLLYEMLVGQPPFAGGSVAESLERIISADLRPPVELPEGACDLIRRLIQAEPEARLPLDVALRHPWLQAEVPPSRMSADARPVVAAVAPAATVVPKIGGLVTLEGLAEKVPSGRSLFCPGAGAGTVDAASAAQQKPTSPIRGRAGGLLLGAALRPCTPRTAKGKGLGGYADGARGQSPPSTRASHDFLLQSALEPVSQLLTARGDRQKERAADALGRSAAAALPARSGFFSASTEVGRHKHVRGCPSMGP